jgi:peptide-methionine (R)-S-oxide reductase
MFDSDLDKQGGPRKFGRRAFLLTSATTAVGALFWSLRKPTSLEAAAQAAQGPPGEVTIVEFSDDGKKIKKSRVPKVVKTEAEWQQQLSPAAFTITRHAGTELSFSGQYWNLHDKGLYRLRQRAVQIRYKI